MRAPAMPHPVDHRNQGHHVRGFRGTGCGATDTGAPYGEPSERDRLSQEQEGDGDGRGGAWPDGAGPK